MNPIEWSKSAIERQGWQGAFLLARDLKVPSFGEKPDTVANKNMYFYRNAYAWMRKRLPQEVVNNLASMSIKP